MWSFCSCLHSPLRDKLKRIQASSEKLDYILSKGGMKMVYVFAIIMIIGSFGIVGIGWDWMKDSPALQQSALFPIVLSIVSTVGIMGIAAIIIQFYIS